jgi:hypothetical protein
VDFGRLTRLVGRTFPPERQYGRGDCGAARGYGDERPSAPDRGEIDAGLVNLARNPAVDTTTTVAAGRVAADCVVVVTSASRLHSLTDRQGRGTRAVAGYSKLYLASRR